ncbi:DODA-type extradiol aromatic ring-opening family dioxygenase [Novosphingobium cyanobacteriorum]|uniref:Class III extradiol ring-cleavage dioxygenase n=1 Tax=Novosphingobium cyanobacteriorum TaxID=3024215 RepID=A0ABT6CDC3_9SPHN|nr:class III extradiol ring-cleavage dioxygenase [Novosphingobium cyanobacteriorum]MDF8331926.1 class III extradiol ring-cleavage dioxygenase [Novosphingobium cyanobacteriorum]
MNRQPVFFLSHGGGPWPWLEGEFRRSFDWLEASLKALPAQLPEPPTAVLAVSGHWEEPGFAVSTAAEPDMVYDYSGFPEHTYHIRYPAPGSPAVAERVVKLAAEAGIPVARDPQRGFDHGTFSMLQPIYPQADVPVVSLSMRQDYDPAAHLALGRALAPLRDEGVLIIGSGFSYHNLRLFDERAFEPSAGFDAWLRHALIDLPPEERAAAMLRWSTAPFARVAHAREDHLVPLFVAVGAAGDDPATCVYSEARMRGGITASSYRFGQDTTPTGFDLIAERVAA